MAEVAAELSRAGLVCEVMDGLPLSLSRAVGLMYGGECGPTAALDWGFASTTFCLVSAGVPIFSRHLRNCGFAKLFETVGQMLDLPEDDLLAVLAQYGLPEESVQDEHVREIQAVIAEAARPHLTEIVEELRRTMDYVGIQFSGMRLERLCLTGDGTAMRHANAFPFPATGLARGLVELCRQGWRIPRISRQARCRGWGRRSPSPPWPGLPIAEGASMKSFVNLLPLSYRRRHLVRRVLVKWSLVWLACGGIGAAAGGSSGSEASRSSRRPSPPNEAPRPSSNCLPNRPKMQASLKEFEAKGRVWGQVPERTTRVEPVRRP